MSSEIIREINEDTVHVYFYLALDKGSEIWNSLCSQINATIKTLSQGYIWHRDEFKVCFPILFENTNGIPIHLKSTTCFGDNIEDEWFIVYILFEISKLYTDLIIQITDNDGDFLLIEAADYLPSWINPENSENRVFIHNNNVHIIPTTLANLKNELEIKDALQFIARFPEKTKVSTAIQDAIVKRVSDYPKKINDSFHKAVVKLPIDIAAIINLQPSLISPIVTTYCNHDPFDAKACKNLCQHNEYINTEVKFTKCLYAMLMHSKLIQNVKHFGKSNNKKDILGLKLTCGFEMITSSRTKYVFHTKDYQRFENNLKKNGYFQGNVEGSLQYNQLLEKAKTFYLDIECPINSYVSEKISAIMVSDDFKQCKENLRCQILSETDLVEDSDDWLKINPNQLNELLNNRYGEKNNTNTDDVISPETITSKLTTFLEQSSDYEGIDTKPIDETETDRINFEADKFVNYLEKMMSFLSSDANDIYKNDDSDTDLSFGDNNSDLDDELAGKLVAFNCNRNSSKNMLSNLTQSIKEEGLSGPSSNLLTTIGVNKTDLLDSDDDNADT